MGGCDVLCALLFRVVSCCYVLCCGCVVIQLLELGADPVSINMSGDTPLHDAVRMTYPQVVKVLVENGANPNQVLV